MIDYVRWLYVLPPHPRLNPPPWLAALHVYDCLRRRSPTQAAFEPKQQHSWREAA